MLQIRPNRTVIALSALILSACSGTLELPKIDTQVDVARQPEASPASHEAASGAPQEDDPQACDASEPGQVIGFDEFFAATLKGSEGERLYISAAPGAEPGESYGVAGDEVEAIATALDNNCDAWTWIKWPESDYRGWLPASSIELERDSGDSDQPTKARAQRVS